MFVSSFLECSYAALNVPGISSSISDWLQFIMSIGKAGVAVPGMLKSTLHHVGPECRFTRFGVSFHTLQANSSNTV